MAQQWAPAGNSIKHFSRCWGECFYNKPQNLSSSSPGAALDGPRDGWCCREANRFGPLQGRFTGEASTLSAGAMGWDTAKVSMLVLWVERHCVVGDS